MAQSGIQASLAALQAEVDRGWGGVDPARLQTRLRDAEMAVAAQVTDLRTQWQEWVGAWEADVRQATAELRLAQEATAQAQDRGRTLELRLEELQEGKAALEQQLLAESDGLAKVVTQAGKDMDALRAQHARALKAEQEGRQVDVAKLEQTEARLAGTLREMEALRGKQSASLESVAALGGQLQATQGELEACKRSEQAAASRVTNMSRMLDYYAAAYSTNLKALEELRGAPVLQQAEKLAGKRRRRE